MCMLPSDLKTLLHNLLKKCSQPTLKLVYKRSVENIVQDLKNGVWLNAIDLSAVHIYVWERGADIMQALV